MSNVTLFLLIDAPRKEKDRAIEAVPDAKRAKLEHSSEPRRDSPVVDRPKSAGSARAADDADRAKRKRDEEEQSRTIFADGFNLISHLNGVIHF